MPSHKVVFRMTSSVDYSTWKRGWRKQADTKRNLNHLQMVSWIVHSFPLWLMNSESAASGSEDILYLFTGLSQAERQACSWWPSIWLRVSRGYRNSTITSFRTIPCYNTVRNRGWIHSRRFGASQSFDGHMGKWNRGNRRAFNFSTRGHLEIPWRMSRSVNACKIRFAVRIGNC